MSQETLATVRPPDIDDAVLVRMYKEVACCGSSIELLSVCSVQDALERIRRWKDRKPARSPV